MEHFTNDLNRVLKYGRSESDLNSWTVALGKAFQKAHNDHIYGDGPVAPEQVLPYEQEVLGPMADWLQDEGDGRCHIARHHTGLQAQGNGGVSLIGNSDESRYRLHVGEDGRLRAMWFMPVGKDGDRKYSVILHAPLSVEQAREFADALPQKHRSAFHSYIDQYEQKKLPQQQ